MLTRVKGFAKALEASRVALVKPLNDTVDRINAMFKPQIAALKGAEDGLKGYIRRFEDEQDRVRRDEQARLQRLADERAAAERRRLADEAAEKARKAAELEAAGKVRSAEAMRQQSATMTAQAEKTVAPVVISAAPVMPRTAGTVSAKRWTYEITDRSQIPDEYWVIDEVKLRKAVMVNPSGCTIPGVRAYQETEIRA